MRDDNYVLQKLRADAQMRKLKRMVFIPLAIVILIVLDTVAWYLIDQLGG